MENLVIIDKILLFTSIVSWILIFVNEVGNYHGQKMHLKVITLNKMCELFKRMSENEIKEYVHIDDSLEFYSKNMHKKVNLSISEEQLNNKNYLVNKQYKSIVDFYNENQKKRIKFGLVFFVSVICNIFWQTIKFII